ncbi:MAG: hypothetical protein NTV56_19075 [Alphaproteobacteria bacterium]|nr:hypothetical protein [Alphaproteobacteria bacterium]
MSRAGWASLGEAARRLEKPKRAQAVLFEVGNCLHQNSNNENSPPERRQELVAFYGTFHVLISADHVQDVATRMSGIFLQF